MSFYSNLSSKQKVVINILRQRPPRKSTLREDKVRGELVARYKVFANVYEKRKCGDLIWKNKVNCRDVDTCYKSSTNEANLRFQSSQIGNGEIQDWNHLVYLLHKARESNTWKNYKIKECGSPSELINSEIFNYDNYQGYRPR